MAIADPTTLRDASARDATGRDALDSYRAETAYLGGYLGADHARNERRTWIVAAICAVMLAVQVTGGLLFHSVALLAAGVHMGAHVAALLVASLAYALA